MGGPHDGDWTRGPRPRADAVYQKEEGRQKAGGQENGKAGEKRAGGEEHHQEKVDKNDKKDDKKELKGFKRHWSTLEKQQDSSGSLKSWDSSTVLSFLLPFRLKLKGELSAGVSKHICSG